LTNKVQSFCNTHVKSFADAVQLHIWKLAPNNGMHDYAEMPERELVSQGVLLDNVLQYS
jgi:hypothetical protein